MHDSVMKWVTEQVEKYDLSEKSVLEVGSRNVNGSCRTLFTGKYLGIDMVAGPGVDFVCDVTEWLALAQCEVCLSTEMLEHCADPLTALILMTRSLRYGGYLILTCRGFDEGDVSRQHSEPDYFRISKSWMEWAFKQSGLEALTIEDDPQNAGVFAVGRKAV